MKKHFYMLKTCLCAVGLGLLSSCSSDTEDALEATGTGLISFQVTTDTGFQTRAVSEADYKNRDNYTVQLFKDGSQLNEWKYTALPSELKVDAGTYHLKAFYGQDVAASTTSMYVEGVGEDVAVAANLETPTTLSVACKPACAKVVVDFDKENLDKYFSDYSVTFKTKALGSDPFVWTKTATDPVYLKVEQNESVTAVITGKYKDSSSADASIEKTYTLSPAGGLTLAVGIAGDATGSISLNITVDDKTNDIEQDIEVPSDWVTDETEE